MDRQIVYTGAIPQDTDLLQQNKNAMIGLGYLMLAVMGSATLVDGLACTPNSPAALNVLVGPGSIYSLAAVDATAYGSIAADTADLIVKQGIVMTTQTFSTPAPVTTGQSVVYLIQAAYQDVDGGSTVLPYYNASNPSVAWSGPNNTGISQNTVRKGVCTVSIKTGVAATTGTQTTPAPDAGFTGLYAVTVANGQSTVTSGNIKTLPTAPFIGTKLPNILAAIQQDAPNYSMDTSGSANTITVTLSPDPGTLDSDMDGMPIRVKVANSSTGATVMNVNGHGNIACKTTSGSDFTTNTVVANGIYTFVYDANGNRLQLQGFTAASGTGLLPANNLSDVSSAPTSLSNLGGAPLASPAFTGNPTAATQTAGNSSTRLATTAFVNSTALTLANGTTATTQSASDSSTKLATTAFVQSNIVVTPLGVNSLVLAAHTSGTVSAGGTVAGSSLTPVVLVFAGASSGVTATGDTLTGTWQSLMTYGSAASGNVGLWQRIS
ncbi:hypothetical protein [Zavarzinella formosa]|uniref:hypothetical protein n=1 Tax=Zavarzinella formosa TaxID=360055 RepID=UPI0002EEAC2F|nr:hypothetical protein [Zavarzinella formosa]